jgi:lipopolysaccharide heptosyltransferase I
LVIRLGAIGDVLRTLPAIVAWQRASPGTRFTWLVEPAAASLLRGHPALAEVLVFERGLFAAAGRPRPRSWGEGLIALARLRSRLRRADFELVVDFHGILKSAVFARMTEAPVRIGFGRGAGKEGSHRFYTHHFTPSRADLNRVDRARELVTALGVPFDPEIAYRLPVTAEHRRRGRILSSGLRELNHLSGPKIVIHPGSSPATAYKRWHLNGYVGLVEALVERLGARVLLTWGPGERETVELIAGRVRVPLAVAGQTASLLDLAAVFSVCDLYIGGDTGPMHLAAAVATPVVAIFGPTHPGVNAPRGVPFRLVRRPRACSPCRKRSCQSRSCLETIGWRQVFAAVSELLAEPGVREQLARG